MCEWLFQCIFLMKTTWKSQVVCFVDLKQLSKYSQFQGKICFIVLYILTRNVMRILIEIQCFVPVFAYIAFHYLNIFMYVLCWNVWRSRYRLYYNIMDIDKKKAHTLYLCLFLINNFKVYEFYKRIKFNKNIRYHH